MQGLAKAVNQEPAQLTPDQVAAALSKLGRELIAVIGFEAAMKLIEERGGQRIMVPSWPHMRHSSRFEALVEIVGEKAAQQLGDRWGGIEIQVPMGSRVNQLRRMRALIHDYGKGVPVSELVRRYQVTESTVWKWLKKPV